MTSAALKTDLYQLTMAAGYFHRGLMRTRATCEMFVRRLPKPRRYLVANGIEATLDYLREVHFTEEQIAYLREIPALRDAMSDDFCDYLRDFRFRGDVWAVPEGTVMFAGEPFVRLEADIIEAQLVETFLLSTINHGTMVASKAARIVRAAKTAGVLEFGTRRTHSAEAVDSARAAYLVGAAGTSNVEAGMRFGIPVQGTAAHMWTMTHDSEEAAFQNYVETFPNAAVLLIDTYDTVRGAERAARIAGDKLAGVRLDSGDMLALSREVRRVLDDHGLEGARIVASGDLNEYKIAAFVAAEAPIDVYGVGTELVCSKDAPSLGGVYKVVQFERDGRTVPIAKFSEGKATYPGAHQVHRFETHDVLALAHEEVPDGAKALSSQRIASGRAMGDAPTLEATRAYARRQLDSLPEVLHALEPTTESLYAVRLSEPLQTLVSEVKEKRV